MEIELSFVCVCVIKRLCGKERKVINSNIGFCFKTANIYLYVVQIINLVKV